MKHHSVYLDNVEFEKIKDDALLLDVRSNIEFKTLKQMPNSVNVYIFDLLANPEQYLPDKEQLIVTLCNGGNRSSESAIELRKHGYHNAYVLRTGIYGYYRWKETQK